MKWDLAVSGDWGILRRSRGQEWQNKVEKIIAYINP